MDPRELDALLASLDASGDALPPLDTESEVIPPDDEELSTTSSSASLLDDVAVWWEVHDDDVPNIVLPPPLATPPLIPDTRGPNGATQHQQPDSDTRPTASQNRTDGGAYARVVASRRRAKSELEHLRRRVQDLERQLAQARAAHEPPAKSTPSGLDSRDTITTQAVDQFWQRLAQSERQARQSAVVENLQLRSQLEAQIRTARSLEKLLCKRPHGVGSVPHDTAFKRLRVGYGSDHEDPTDVYEALLMDMDERYLQTDAVLEESGLSSRRETFQDAHVRLVDGTPDTTSVPGDGHCHPNSTASSSCVEFVTAHVVPFSYEMTRDVAWRALQSTSIPLTNGMYEVVETSEDGNTIKALFTVHTKLRGSDVVSRARFVARRYIEDCRVVVVWALASTVQGGILKNHRLELLEEGWSAISPLHPTNENVTDPLSLTQACGRLRPRMVVRAGSKLDELVGLLTDVFLDCYHDTQQGLYDFTGRMLLEESVMHR